ncbi:MAG: PAS domain S-box protein [Verrucomicrobiota bacterium]
MNSARRRMIVATLISLFTIGEWVADLNTPLGISDWVWYVIPLLLSVYVGGRSLPFLLAAVYSVLTLAGLFLSPPGIDFDLAFSGRMVGIGVFWLMALIIWQRKWRVDALWKLNRALRLISLCNQEMVRATDEGALLQAVCRIVVEAGGYRMAWVGFAERDKAMSVRPVAHAGFEEGYLDNLNVTCADAGRGRGPVGTAIRTGKPVPVRNIATNPAFLHWRAAAIERGYASSAALPLIDENGRCFGALMIYAGEPDAFDSKEIELLTEMAGDLAFGIGALRHRAERHLAEEALQESQALYHSLVEQMPVGVFRKDRAGRYVFVNSLFCKLYGLKADQILGRTPDELVPMEIEAHGNAHPEILQLLRNGSKHHEEILRTGKPVYVEETHPAAGGAERHLHVVKSAVCDPAGKIVGTQGVQFDVTALKQAETALNYERDLWRTLLDNSPDHIYFKDTQSRFIKASKAQARQFGVKSPDEMVGKTDFDFFDEAHARPAFEDEQEIIRTGQPMIAKEEREVWKDGHVTWASSTKMPLRDAAGKITGIMGISRDITERKQMEEKMALEQARFKLIFGSVPVGIAYSIEQPNGQYKYTRIVNDAYLEICGLTREQDQVPGIYPRLTHPEDAARQQKLVNELVKDKVGKYAMEKRYVRPDGKIVWVAFTFQRRKLPDGNFEVLITVVDITERKRAEEVLRQSQEEFKDLFENAPVGFHEINAGGRLVRINNTELKMLGYSAEELLGQLVWKISADEETSRRATLAKLDGEPPPPGGFERMFRRKDGSAFPVLINDRVLKREDGAITGIRSTVQDITGRKRAEQQLTDEFNFNQRIISGASVGIIAYKSSGQCVLANEAAAQAINATVPRLLAQNFRQIVSWRVSGMIQMAEEVLATKESRQGEAHFVSTFGREVWLLCHFSHFVQNGESHLLLIFNDLTEKKKLETQFLRAQRMESVGTLAGGIAHDLNNVLAPLLFAVQILKGKISDDEGQRMLKILEANVQRGANLVKQVLAFGRGIQGERIMVQPKHIANEIKQIVQETFPKSVEFEFQCSPDLWLLTGDPTQIEQVLLNLCVNARDAMPRGGKLSLQVENKMLDETRVGANSEAKPGPYVVISVTDTGAGMTKEIQDRIFEPFFTTKELGKGTGLGLSTSLAIVKSHEGFITCYSEQGKGSTFKVHLPASPGTAAAGQTAGGKSGLPCGHNELILVVDDEEPIRNIAQKLLERYGYRVLLAVNGAEAVKLYAARHDEIAVVLTDMAMPVMGGSAAIAALQSINPKVRIIGSSGFEMKDDPAGGDNTRPRHFIPKPYSAETVLNMLHEILHEDPVK